MYIISIDFTILEIKTEKYNHLFINSFKNGNNKLMIC